MKTPKQQKNGLGSAGKVAGVVAAACVGAACPGSQVRRAPPPEDCPPGALAAMEKLGIKPGDDSLVTFDISDGVQHIIVREGDTFVLLYKAFKGLPPWTTVTGRLIFGDNLVYGRFTRARTRKGDEFPVCLMLQDDTQTGVGLVPEGNEGPGTARVFSTVSLRAVERFQ